MKPGQKFPSAGYKKGTAMYSPLPASKHHLWMSFWSVLQGNKGRAVIICIFTETKGFIDVGKDNKNTYDGSMIGVPGGGGSELVEKGMFL